MSKVKDPELICIKNDQNKPQKNSNIMPPFKRHINFKLLYTYPKMHSGKDHTICLKSYLSNNNRKSMNFSPMNHQLSIIVLAEFETISVQF